MRKRQAEDNEEPLFCFTSNYERERKKRKTGTLVWGWCCQVVTHSEPAAMSRYEVSAVSTPTGMTMLMTFSADQFLSY